MSTYLDGTRWVSTTAILAGCQVLPEKTVIDMSTAVEIDHGLQRDRSSDISLLLCRSNLFRGSIEAIDICLVVILVVQLHYLARDGWL